MLFTDGFFCQNMKQITEIRLDYSNFTAIIVLVGMCQRINLNYFLNSGRLYLAFISHKQGKYF